MKHQVKHTVATLTPLNTSGVTGVNYCIQSNLWESRAYISGKRRRMGRYATKAIAFSNRISALVSDGQVAKALSEVANNGDLYIPQ